MRGTVPQIIRKGTKEEIRLMFRPAAVYKNASVVVSCGDKEIARKRAMIFTPGEMAVIPVTPDKLEGVDGEITVKMEVRK